MEVKYSINSFINDMVDRDTKKRKGRRKEKLQAKYKERYYASLQRSLIANFLYTNAYIVMLFIIACLSYVSMQEAFKQSYEYGSDIMPEVYSIVAGVFFFIFGALFLAYLPKVITSTYLLVKNRSYINVIDKNPKYALYNLKTFEQTEAIANERANNNPLNRLVLDETDKVAYRLYEFVDLEQSSFNDYSFIVPDDLTIQSSDYQLTNEYTLVSNKMDYEAIGEYIYRSYNDIKDIEHNRYKEAVADFPLHQHQSKTTTLINDMNK